MFKIDEKMTFATSILKFFFQKKFFAFTFIRLFISFEENLSNSITDYFFDLPKFFTFFVVAPHQQFFEIFEKVEYLHDHEELCIGNGTVFSLSDPLSENLKIF